MLLSFPVTEIHFLIYLHSKVAGTGMETKEGDHTQQPLVILCANCERDAEISAAAASAKVEGLQLFEVCVCLCSDAQAYRGGQHKSLNASFFCKAARGFIHSLAFAPFLSRARTSEPIVFQMYVPRTFWHRLHWKYLKVECRSWQQCTFAV